ncbi:MAG: hypothetical protein KAH14_00680 [Clostridiales bacterium]|nr:hypothetical protein [Clostridiales bacterium]
MDTILIAILTALIIGISAVIMRDRKKGGCASCPYNNSCASKENCTESNDR